ncbi:unnamed protein product, partial [Schistosoma turkestanicum]
RINGILKHGNESIDSCMWNNPLCYLITIFIVVADCACQMARIRYSHSLLR